MALGTCVARAENLVINGDFSWQAIGTMATKSGAGGQADSTTFSNWRLFTVNATNGTYLRGTIVSNPVVGGVAMRLDYVRAGPVPSDFGLDRDTARMPVAYRQGYLVSFDAAYVSGSTNLQVVLPEFKSDHSFVGQQVVKTVAVANTVLQRFTYHWTPLNAATVEMGTSFKPVLTGTNLTMSVMIDDVRVTPVSVYNGSFETEAAGTEVTITNKTATNNGTSFSAWRVFSVGTAPVVDDMAATLVTNASDGNVAMRLSWAGRGGQNHALDNNDTKNPYVQYGTNYTIAFDVAYVSGSTNLAFTVQEHNSAGFVSKQTTYHFAVTNTAYQTVTIKDWTPLTNATDRVVLAFNQMASGTTSNSVLLLDNVQMSASLAFEGDLYTSKPAFSVTNHIVSASVFSWFDAAGGQISGPWRPLEGRAKWTGETDWWKSQVKQMMMANIDLLYVQHCFDHEPQKMNLFKALNQLRSEGFDVPRVAPFLDPPVTWYLQPTVDLATTVGKDTFVNQYIRFFNQYYAMNPDPYADDYLATFGNRVVCDVWHVKDNCSNVSSLKVAEVTARLSVAFGQKHPAFTNNVYMVTTALNPPTLSFADEKVAQFEITDYYKLVSYNSISSVQLKGGYWDQNVRNPGSILKRDGGWHYTNAWNQVNRSTVRRVYIESWNEYDEGSGIYAADPGAPYIHPGSGNTSTDVWSGASDPYAYIRATAKGAAAFNDVPDRDAKILWHNFPARMERGEARQVRVIVRNAGDASWTAAGNYKFGEVEFLDAVMFGPGRYLIDDEQDEIPVYGGVFRGRPKTFQLTLTAPMQAGTYMTHWRMVQEQVAWFGEELAISITVVNTANPCTVMLLL